MNEDLEIDYDKIDNNTMLMSAKVPKSWNLRRKQKGLSWESVIKQGLRSTDQGLQMNERFNSLFAAKVEPRIKEMQKRIFDLEQENERYIEKLAEVKK